jgi:murein DD-endopeptidase MepM/ murein hydrolase activator NlpD
LAAVCLGSAAIALSLYLPGRIGNKPAAPLLQDVLGEQLEAVDAAGPPSQAKRVTVDSPATQLPAAPSSEHIPARTPQPSRGPIVREAAPVNALPVVKSRSVSSSTGGSSAALRPGEAGFSISVVASDGGGVGGVAETLAGRLSQRGTTARVETLEDYGVPDAILVLARKTGAGAEAWFCDPGPPLGASFAAVLKSSVPRAGDSPAETTVESPATVLPCDELRDGRERVPAVLLELPADALDGASQPELTEALSSAIGRFFSDNAAAVRRARVAPRLVWPAYGPITSYFGPSHPLGIDIGQLRGGVVSATEGKVVFAGGDPCCSYGRYVVVDSPDGVRTLYAHLETLAVRTGQKVRQGQAVGRVGCTGHCLGTHLHFEVIIDGVRRDPLRYLR